MTDYQASFDRRFPVLLMQVKNRLEAKTPGSRIPDSLWRAMQYSALSPGKRLRPRLLLAVSETARGSPGSEVAYGLAAAVELLHAFTLVHDDLPLLDNDEWRRGRPTSHRLFGGGLALLAGDGLMALAWEMLLQSTEDLSPAARKNAVEIFSVAAGPAGVIGGQVLEMELERDSIRAASPVEWEQVYRLKTGILFNLSARLGILAANRYEIFGRTEKALIEYSDAFGFAFQVADDIEDRDQDAGRVNYSNVVGLEFASKQAEMLIDRTFNHLTDCCGQAPVSPDLALLHRSLRAKLESTSSL